MDRRTLLWLSTLSPVAAVVRGVPVAHADGYSEAPSLALKVGLGALPPLDQRLPSEPLVITPEDGPGSYGGTLRVPHLQDSGHDQGLVRRHYSDRNTFLPNIARAFEWGNNFSTITFWLRPGTRWSDGTPYTADDIMFWWDDVVKAPWHSRPYAVAGMNTQTDTVVKVDDYVVRFEFSEPRPNFLIASRGGWSYGYYGYPRNYFQRYHPKYTPKEGTDAAAQFNQLLDRLFQNNWIRNDPQAPTLLPWKTTAYVEKQIWRAERNPFYWAVDPNGQQLPYLDGIESAALTDGEKELIKLKLLAGEADVAFRSIALQDYPLYKENGPRAGFSLLRFPSTYNGPQSLAFNQASDDAKMAPLLRDPDFRRALSLGIDRDLINEIAYLGLGRPGHGFSVPGTYDAQIDGSWAQYDAARAGRMLDGLGLNRRDRDGFRTFADGSALTLELLFRPGWGEGSDRVSELVADNWSKLGIRTRTTPAESALYNQRATANTWQVRMIAGLGGITANWQFTMYYSLFAGPQADWWASRQQAQPRGVEPTGALRQLAQALESALNASDPASAAPFFQQYRTILADQLFMMGVAMDTGTGLAVNSKLRNVPGLTRPQQVSLQQGEGEYLDIFQWYFA